MAEGEQDSNPVKTDSADDDTDEESEVLEESPCGRWQKRREEVWFFRMNQLQANSLSFFLLILPYARADTLAGVRFCAEGRIEK